MPATVQVNTRLTEQEHAALMAGPGPETASERARAAIAERNARNSGPEARRAAELGDFEAAVQRIVRASEEEHGRFPTALHHMLESVRHVAAEVKAWEPGRTTVAELERRLFAVFFSAAATAASDWKAAAATFLCGRTLLDDEARHLRETASVMD